MRRIALALLVAALAVAACRRDDAPAPAAAPAAPAAPASELAALHSAVGRYPRDIEFFETNPLSGRLARLLGDRLPVFLENMGVQGPVSEEGGLIYVTGNRPHEGGEEAAALVIDPARDALYVWLLSGGEQRTYFEKQPAPATLPEDVRITLENWKRPD